MLPRFTLGKQKGSRKVKTRLKVVFFLKKMKKVLLHRPSPCLFSALGQNRFYLSSCNPLLRVKPEKEKPEFCC